MRSLILYLGRNDLLYWVCFLFNDVYGIENDQPTWQDCRGELFPKYIWKKGLGVVVSQDVDVGDHQANNHHGLQSDQTPVKYRQ